MHKTKSYRTVIAEDVNTPLSIINKSSRQKISKNIEGENNTVNQYGLIEHYPTAAECVELTMITTIF